MSARLSTRAPKPPLLLVDDDELIVETLALVLEDDYEVHTAATRPKAKALLRKYPGKEIAATALAGELEADMALAPGTGEADFDSAAERQLRTPGFCLDEIMERWERRYIDAALKLSHGNLSQAARVLGINRTTLYSRIERLNHPRR